MAKNEGSSIGTVVVVGLVGFGAWWIYENFFATAPAALAASSASGATPPAAPASATSTAAPASSAAAAPSYSGPDLDTMYSHLQSAVVAAYGKDPALTCPSGVSGVGAVSAGTVARQTTQITAPETQGGHPAAVAGGVAPRRIAAPAGSIQASKPSCPAASISGTYDVFNFYLLQQVPSIGQAPQPPDHTTVMTLTQYWQWAAPVLKAAIPGLSGYGRHGLGAIWGSGYAVRARR